jgi:hypothetical protein
MNIQVTVSGATTSELIKNLTAATAALSKATPVKRAAATEDEDTDTETETDDLDSVDDQAEVDGLEDTSEEASFDDIEEEETPKSAKGKKTKITLSDINAAALKHAKKFKKEKTLKILAKFKVKSVNELKTSQYEQVLAALKV